MIATDLMGIALPWLIKEAIDAVVQKKIAGVSLLYYPALLLGAAVFQGFFRYCWRININGFSRRSEADLREQVFTHLQRLPLRYYQHHKTGDLMSRLTNDIQAVRELLGFGSLAIVDALVVIVFSLSCMILINPWLTLWSMLAMPMITVTVRYFSAHIFRWSHSVQEQMSDMSAYVQENLAGIRVVQAYAQEENQTRAFATRSSEYMRRTMWLATLWGVFWPLMRVVSGSAAVIVLWLGGRAVLQGSMTLGEFVAFNGYLGMLTWPLMAIGYVVNQYQRGTAALSRLSEVLDVEPSPRYFSLEAHPAGCPRHYEVAFRDLVFSYRDNAKPVLDHINLTIPAGKVCGIVGETGAGKSTLAHLLVRLYEAPDNTIFIGGIDIKKIPLHALTSAVGIVSQDIFLFSGTLRDNIAFGVLDGEKSAVEDASRIAQLLPAVREFREGFETVVGERGVKLSGGQKQRAALARALVKSPPILILDDAFASVDVETEENILAGLKGFMAGRTTLLISHRISTVRKADLIVYLSDGKIIEQGSHDALVARRGPYFHLYQRQQWIREVENLKQREGPL